MAQLVSRSLVAAATVLAVLMGTAPGAGAADPTTPRPQPASGWERAADTEGAPTLVWHSPSPLRMGDARVEVRLDGRLLAPGRVSADGRTVTVSIPARLAADPAVDWSSLSVVAGGRPLGGGAPGQGAAPARQAPGGASTPSAPSAPSAASGPTVDGGAEPAPAALRTDPGTPGPHATTTAEYSLGTLAIPELPAPVEVRGVVVAPVGSTGARPLVVMLHGRHPTCFDDQGEITGDWPCPAGMSAIPSHRGYLQTQRLLASQGYLSVSIAANGINGQDGMLPDGGAAARAVLVRHHLGLWAGWSRSAGAHASAPAAVRAAPLADLGRVLLVGHSRGGEGMNRAALDSTTGDPVPWTVRGQVLYAPTAFGQNPAPGVPVAVLLPYCDGDVSDLQGQAYVDAARGTGADPALRSAVLVIGANHNYFNTEWTPGAAKAPAWDDWWDPTDRVCGDAGSTRLSAAQQRSVGATYTAAAAAAFVTGDASATSLLDGTPVRAASAGSARVLTHALGGRRSPVLLPGAATAVASAGGVSTTLCRTVDVARPDRRCAPEAGSEATPHFLPLFGFDGEPSRRTVAVEWARASGSASLPLVGDLSSAEGLELRVAVPPRAGSTFGLRLVDRAGRALTLPDVHLGALPGGTADGGVVEGKYWAREVRVPLDAAAVRASGLDPSAVVRLDLLPRSESGRLWVLDAWAWRAGVSTAAPLRLPRLDVGRLTVTEGSTDRTVRVPITVTGPARAASRVWVAVVDWHGVEAPRGTTVVVPRGATRLDVAVTVSGDRRDDLDETDYAVAIESVRGVAVGDYLGGVTVRDDDPTPTVRVVAVATDVTEGAALRWRFVLSAPSDLGTYLPLAIVRPGASSPREVDTSDVPADWLAERGLWEVPRPAVALSRAQLWMAGFLDAGQDSLELTVPTLADGRTEGPESLVLEVTDEAPVPGLPAGTQLVGTVRDA